MKLEATAYLHEFQQLLSLPRETVPQLTAEQARRSLARASEALGTELIENKGIVPWFLLLPPPGVTPDVVLFATWHAESIPVFPASLEGAERLALAASLAALGTAREDRERAAAIVVAPGSTQGSLVLQDLLRQHRSRLKAPISFWFRIAAPAPRRRRVFLGSRGRVVVGIWGEGANPYRIRDQVIEELSEKAYGPRPLDFELLHKLGASPAALEFLEEALGEGAPAAGAGEEALRRALFEPAGHVIVPQVRHPDRPRAWIAFETAENMEPDEILGRVVALAQGSKVEMAEGFFWDRTGIHHPATQAEIKFSKTVSEGPEIWPMAPWLTPSGVFTRTLGTPLTEWSIPIQPSVAIRSPKVEDFEPIVSEAGGLIAQALLGLREAEE